MNYNKFTKLEYKFFEALHELNFTLAEKYVALGVNFRKLSKKEPISALVFCKKHNKGSMESIEQKFKDLSKGEYWLTASTTWDSSGVVYRVTPSGIALWELGLRLKRPRPLSHVLSKVLVQARPLDDLGA